MIGSQVSAKLSMPSQNEPPLPETVTSSGSGSTRTASVPSSRLRTCDWVSNVHPAGRSAPGSRSAARSASLASLQFSCEVSSTVSL